RRAACQRERHPEHHRVPGQQPGLAVDPRGEEQPGLHLGRQLAAAAGDRCGQHDPQGTRALSEEQVEVAIRKLTVAAVALAALAGAAAASLTLGAVHVPLNQVLDALLGKADPGPMKEIILTLRLPRTVEALTVGASLGVAGALLQGALANPLASPDVIGVTGGSGFGAILILLVYPGSIALLP